jgi:hypothetical protein
VPPALVLTRTGDGCFATLPLPSCPSPLRPHAHTDPLALTARQWSRPAITSITFATPGTTAGVVRAACVPFPSWPYALLPHV